MRFAQLSTGTAAGGGFAEKKGWQIGGLKPPIHSEGVKYFREARKLSTESHLSKKRTFQKDFLIWLSGRGNRENGDYPRHALAAPPKTLEYPQDVTLRGRFQKCGEAEEERK